MIAPLQVSLLRQVRDLIWSVEPWLLRGLTGVVLKRPNKAETDVSCYHIQNAIAVFYDKYNFISR